jgi:uncharacterized membrane protein
VKAGDFTALLLTLLFASGCGRRQEQTRTQPLETSPPDSFEYAAHGNEPFWSVSVTPEEIVFRTPDNIDGARGPYAPPTREDSMLTFRTVLGDSAGSTLELAIAKRPCSDGMSDREYAYAAAARVGDRMLNGCAERWPMAPQGEWLVVAHRTPGISAMSDSEATAWHGRAVSYTSTRAMFGAESCLHPSYLSRQVRGDSLLSVGYHSNPSVLGLARNSTVTVIEVRCDESAWSAPGGILLRMPSGKLYAPWNGVFYELQRRGPTGDSSQ